MENKLETASEDFEDAEDVLSLCNLPIQGYEREDVSRYSSTSSDQELFEFFTGFSSELRRNNSVDRTDGLEVTEYWKKRDYSCLKSESFHNPRGYQLAGEEREFRSPRRNRSSLDLCQSKKCSTAPKVNITAITSMSAKSRRRMFMFGPVKFEPEMDVCAIRKRQGRRPMKIPPMPEEGETEMVTSGGRRGKSGGPGREGVLLSISHFATQLAKSFGCISASIV